MDENRLFEFCENVRNDQIAWLNLHREHSQHYLTFITAVLAGTLGAIYQFKDNPWLLLTTVIGPIVNIPLCRSASFICDSFYQRFLEEVTIQAKLEALLGFANPRSDVNADSESSMPFSEDQYILPERWLESRRQHTTAAKFVDEKMGSGSNRLMRNVFRILMIANMLLGVAIVVICILHLCFTKAK